MTTCPREAAGIISQAEQVISQKADVSLVAIGFVFIVFLWVCVVYRVIWTYIPKTCRAATATGSDSCPLKRSVKITFLAATDHVLAVVTSAILISQKFIQ
jgi:hypothetical protein